MYWMRYFLSATYGMALLAGIGPAHSQAVGEKAPAPVDAFGPSTVYPGVREYRWNFHVPAVTIEQRAIPVDVLEAVAHPRQWSYRAAEMKTERRKIGAIPEFSCKYPDLMLPNECRTVWRDVYADLPVLVSRERHIDVDVPEWRWQKELLPVVFPRWTWADKSLTVSVPAIVTEKP